MVSPRGGQRGSWRPPGPAVRFASGRQRPPAVRIRTRSPGSRPPWPPAGYPALASLLLGPPFASRRMRLGRPEESGFMSKRLSRTLRTQGLQELRACEGVSGDFPCSVPAASSLACPRKARASPPVTQWCSLSLWPWAGPGGRRGGPRRLHSPWPLPGAVASSLPTRFQPTDELAAALWTSSPLPPEGPAGACSIGASSSAAASAGSPTSSGGLSAKHVACWAGVCGERRR